MSFPFSDIIVFVMELLHSSALLLRLSPNLTLSSCAFSNNFVRMDNKTSIYVTSFRSSRSGRLYLTIKKSPCRFRISRFNAVDFPEPRSPVKRSLIGSLVSSPNSKRICSSFMLVSFWSIST